MTSVLCLIFFLSGAAALIFETLWFHQSGLALGNSIWASSLVLAGFMGGLAFGNGLAGRFGHRVRRRVQLYALLELVIGATGLGLVHLLPALTPLLAPLLRPFVDAPWILNPLRLAIAFALLIVPSTAMGATLPLLVAELFGRDPHFGRVLGRLYGWNTLGAVIGAVAGHALLIEWFGIRGTALVAALTNGVAAAAALGLSRSLQLERRPTGGGSQARPPPLPARATALLAAAFVCGGILLALEVVWFRFLILLILPGSFAFALMLAVVLAGIGGGGLLGSRWLSRRPLAHRHLPSVALGAGALCILTYAIFGEAAGRFQERVVTDWPGMLALGLPLMLPVSLLSGVLFTLLGEALNREAPAETRSAGLLALANTTGAMVGSFAGGFLLLPALGIERSIHLLAVSYGVAAVLAALGGLRPERRREFAALCSWGALLLLLAAFFPFGLMEDRYLQYPLRRFAAAEGSVPVAVREGLTETVIYLRKDVYGEAQYYRLVTNSHSMSTSALTARRYMQAFVYWPIAVHPDPKHALLISYGVGSTAKALTDTRSLETIDVVDISKDILEMSSIIYPVPRTHPLQDPRVTVHVEDGRFFLQVTDRRFDLITGEPPPPKAAGVVNLFTTEYFQLIRNRLAEGGIATYWLPAHSLLEDEAKAIVAAFCQAFEDCSLWTGSDLDWILVGTRNARGPVSLEHFTRQWVDPVVGPELRSLGFELPEQLGALFMAGSDDLRALTRATPALDDDHPKRIGRKPTVVAHVRPRYRSWMDVDKTRERFLRSRLVRRLWPESLRMGSLDFFQFQRAINEAALPDYGGAAARLRRIHWLITASPLRTLVLWRLGSSASIQRAARLASAKGRSGPALDYESGALALAQRDFARAAERFGRAEKRRGAKRDFLYYRIYALCMDGRIEEAEAAAAASGLSEARGGQDRKVWSFLEESFGLDPEAGSPSPKPGAA